MWCVRYAGQSGVGQVGYVCMWKKARVDGELISSLRGDRQDFNRKFFYENTETGL